MTEQLTLANIRIDEDVKNSIKSLTDSIAKSIIRSNVQKKKFYFIAGLPRSGSTLLCSILSNNPRFTAGASNPILGWMMTMQSTINKEELFQADPRPKEATEMVASMIHQYYACDSTPVIFSKNRGWSAHAGTIMHYKIDDNPKIICTVRDIAEIVTSFVSLIHKHCPTGETNMVDAYLVQEKMELTDDNRCAHLASAGGTCGIAALALIEGLKNDRKHIYLVEYDDLVNDTENTIKKIYEFIGEEYYPHKFTDLKNVKQERDKEVYGLPDLHFVRPEINKTSTKPEDLLSKEAIESCRNLDMYKEILTYLPAKKLTK